MTLDAIEQCLEIQAPIAKVWAAISEPTQVSQWFGSSAHYELNEGSVGYFEWQDICVGRYAMRIECIQAPTYLAWRWMQDVDLPFNAKDSTLVEWFLEPVSANQTQLRLVESGFIRTKQRQDNVQGWQQELGDLKDYLQTEKQNPA